MERFRATLQNGIWIWKDRHLEFHASIQIGPVSSAIFDIGGS